MAKDASSTSEEVIPRCSQRADSPASSSTWVRKAMTSCRVRSSISRMRLRVELAGGLGSRTRAAVPAGTRPAASMASQAASSTFSHVS